MKPTDKEAAIPLDLQLWDADFIADLLRVKSRYFQEHIAPVPGFPQAIRLPLARGGRTNPRWKATEVLAWIDGNQERRAA